jgi:CO/xanthine dehydrogenase Mo-binding subunit
MTCPCENNPTPPYQWIGGSVRRIDGQDKVRGSLSFPSDQYAAGMLHCRPVLAPHPHARLLEIQTAEALSVPGVVRVLTSRDVPGVNRYGYRQDHPVLCDDKTRYIGDMVAVVVAESDEAAQAGAQGVKVRYEPLEVVSDPEHSLAGQASLIHPGGNILHQVHHAQGDCTAIFSDPTNISVEQVFCPQFMDHAFLETEAGIAYPTEAGVRVLAGGQNAYYDQQQAAACLGLPLENVQMIEPYTGGAFGGKGDITVQIVIALAARLTGRPCRMAWTRHEHFLAGVKRHAARIRIRCAASPQGELLAVEARILMDTGAYAVFGDSILEVLVENITGPYRVPNVKIDAWSVFTNNAVGGAFRGYGATQACLALEGQMSALARRLQMDEIEFRQRNLLAQGDYSGMGHEILLPLGVPEALKAAASHPLWKNRHQLSCTAGSLRRGVGMALAMKGFSLGANDAPDFGAADITLQANGRFLLQTGIIELGQGSFTALTQMAAEELSCPLEWFDFESADTLNNPEAGTTAASRVTYSVGRVVVAVARQLREQIQQVAAYTWEVPPDQARLAEGAVHNLATGETLSLDQVIRRAGKPLHVALRQRIPYSELPTQGPLGHPHVLYSSNVQLVQCCVDTETGEVVVEQVVCFPEIGKVINRLGLEGQCEGGVAQGIGYALLERVCLDQGRVLNPDFTRYPIPTAADLPPIEVIPIEVPEATGPYGAKGAGENATLPTAPAILDAIDAAIGIRFTELPVTPEVVYQALSSTKESAVLEDPGSEPTGPSTAATPRR